MNPVRVDAFGQSLGIGLLFFFFLSFGPTRSCEQDDDTKAHAFDTMSVL